MIEAKVIADSFWEDGKPFFRKDVTHRVTTMEVTYPRYIHSEMMTHRVFSRNAASSRAIPVAKQLERVRNHPVVPVEFGKNQRGMQAAGEIDNPAEALTAWLEARDDAVAHAERLMDLGVHKQITNRIVEPWMWITTIITSTEWENFFLQRCSPLAQPEIRVAAEMMRAAYEASEPVEIGPMGWHTPYIQKDERDLHVETKKRISSARCARVSYMTHDGIRDIVADLNLYERLATADPGHWSPMEHICTPDKDGTNLGNLVGFKQLRHMVEGAS